MFFVFLKKEKLDFVVFCFSLRDPTVILGITKHRIFSRGCGIEHLNPAPTGNKLDMDIFQAKIYELLGDIEGTKAYIDDILVLNLSRLE